MNTICVCGSSNPNGWGGTFFQVICAKSTCVATINLCIGSASQLIDDRGGREPLQRHAGVFFTAILCSTTRGPWNPLGFSPIGGVPDGEGYWVVCGTVELSVDHLLDKSNGVIHHPVDLQRTHTDFWQSNRLFSQSLYQSASCNVPEGCIADCRHPELGCGPSLSLRNWGITTYIQCAGGIQWRGRGVLASVLPEIWEGKRSESNRERSLSATCTWPGWGLTAWTAAAQHWTVSPWQWCHIKQSTLWLNVTLFYYFKCRSKSL